MGMNPVVTKLIQHYPFFLNDLIFDTLYTSDPAMFSNSLFTLYRQQRAHITKRTKKCVHDPG